MMTEEIDRKEQIRLAKVGIIALIDEATEYQYVRESDELRKINDRLKDIDADSSNRDK